MKVVPGVYVISLLKTRIGIYTIVIPMENFKKSEDIRFANLQDIWITVKDHVPKELIPVLYGDPSPTATYNIVEIHDDCEKPYQRLMEEANECKTVWNTKGILGLDDFVDVV